MSSKRLRFFSLCLLICWILIIVYTAWPTIIQSEEANSFLLSLSHFNPSGIYNKSGTTVSPEQYNVLIYPRHIPDTYLDMVVFIPSHHGDNSFQRRQFLRKKMLNSSYFSQVKIRHVFVFGKFSFFHFLALLFPGAIVILNSHSQFWG